MSENNFRYISDERPLMEFPALMILGIIFISFCVAFSVLFLPWHLSLFLFLGLCLSIIVFLNLYIGIIIFFIGAFFHPTYWFPQLEAFYPARILAFGILFIWAFHVIVFRDFKIVKAPQNYFIIIFMGLAFISSLRNFDFIFPFFLEFSIKALVLYFAISNLVKTREQVISLVWVLVIINIILCFIGLYEYAHGIGDVEAGILRISGLAEESNIFAMDLTIALPLALGLFFAYRKQLILKMFLGAIIFIFVLTTIFTFSRAGLLQLIVVFLLSFWYKFFKKKKIQAILVGALLVLAVTPFVPVRYWDRARSMSNFSDPSIQRRLVGWVSGTRMMLENPIKGVGYGMHRYAFLDYAMEHGYIGSPYYTEPLDAHSIYIQTGSELGIVGLTFLLLLIIWTFKYLRKANRIFRKRNMLLLAELSLALQISMVSYLIASAFLSLLHLLIFWILIPLSVVMYQLAVQYEASEIVAHKEN